MAIRAERRMLKRTIPMMSFDPCDLATAYDVPNMPYAIISAGDDPRPVCAE